MSQLSLRYEDSLKGEVPLLPRRPMYSTFRQVMNDDSMNHIRFHRVVEMGRCPTCAWFNWKAVSCGPEARPHWSELAARHRFLQLEQKRDYARRRAEACAGFPNNQTLYVAMDCSSGYEFVLPHLSAHDQDRVRHNSGSYVQTTTFYPQV